MGPVFPRVAYVLLVLAVLASAGHVEAGISTFWPELGGSASGDGVSQTLSPKAVLDGSVAVGGDGRPVVVYTESSAALTTQQGAIIVKRWTGSTWETLSEPAGVGQGSRPQVQIASNGAIYVAWLTDDEDGNTEIRLRTWNGSTFAALGPSDSLGGLSGPIPDIGVLFSLALDQTGNPIVAFLAVAQTGIVDITVSPEIVDSTVQVYVRRWTGTVWEFLGGDFTGTDGFSGGGASNARSFTSPLGAIAHGVDTPSLAVDSTGAPVVAFAYFTLIDDVLAANTDIYVTRWNGTAWVAVGPAVPAADGAPGRGGAGGISNSSSGSFNPSLAANATGKLALAWEEEPTTGGVYIWVRKWNGSTWKQLAGSATGSGLTRAATSNAFPRTAIGPDGRPIVAWRAVTAIDAPSQIFVRRWNGMTAWEELGLHSARDAGISDAAFEVQAPSLALAPSGMPTIAWLDVNEAGSGQVFLRQFQIKKRLSLTVTGAGFTTSNPAGIDCGDGHTPCASDYDEGTVVSLTPLPSPDSMLSSWTGCTSLNGSICTVLMTANRTVTGKFVAAHTLSVAASGNGSGRITTTTPPGLTCISNCSTSRLLPSTASVTLTPRPAVGTSFRWLDSGNICTGTGACTAVMSQNRSAVGQFTLHRRSLTVGNKPSGNVKTLPDGALIDCGAGGLDCQTTLDFGTPVVLQATPIPGSRFVGWTGNVCNGSTNATCSFRISGINVSVSPGFKNVTTLTLNKSGAGTIVSTPAGIGCGLSCSTRSFDFARGILIKLTPTPAAGWSFVAFAGDCLGATCSVNASAPTAMVNASFSIQQRRLTVTVVGQGSVGGGASCAPGSTPCVPMFDYGTNLALTATAAPGHRFTGWSQSCSGVGGCNALMTVNRSVTATFKPLFGLTVTKPGNSPKQGSITSSPGGIKCGLDCDHTYVGGTVVTLTRTAPATGTTFRWGGACASRGANETCALRLNANASVTANYSLRRLGLTVAKVGAPLGTVIGLDGAVDCGGDCAEVVDYGTPVTLVATRSSSPAGEFVSWKGCATAPSNASCSFKMTANKTVTATFRPVLTSVSVSTIISTTTLPVGGVRQLAAMAMFSDGSKRDVTTQATWRPTTAVTPMPAATVNTTGLVTGRAVGNTSVTATFRGLSGSLPIQVDTLRPGSPISVSCNAYGDASVDPSPQLACLPSGLNFSVHCKALGRFTSAGTQEITDQVAWVTSNAAVARSTGLVAFEPPVRQSFRIVGNGQAILRATLGAKTSSTIGALRTDPWVVQGVTSTVTSVQVTPPTGAVQVRDELPLIATATLAGTGTGACASPPARDFSTIVGWRSSAENVADVTFFGRVTGLAEGGATITATYVRVNKLDFVDTASITVVPQTP